MESKEPDVVLTEQQPVEAETALTPAQTPMPPTMLTDAKQLNTLVKVAKFYADSSLVPDAYRGKPADCFVASELANRMGLSPLIVTQQLAVVKGKPSWSGQACYALIEGTRKYALLDYEFVGEPGKRSYGCRMTAIRKQDGKRIYGSTVTIAMAEDEGWTKNPKWRTMPEQMLQYRAAAFFARTRCPEALMGFSTSDEIEDMEYAKGNDPTAPAAKKKIKLQEVTDA